MKKLHPSFATIILSLAAFISTGSAQTVPGELVLNSGFEDTVLGVPYAWYISPGFIIGTSSVAISGEKSLKFDVKDVGYAPQATHQIAKFENERPYKLQYDVRADRFGVEYRVYVAQWRDATKDDPADTPRSVLVGEVDTQWRQSMDNWHHISVDFKPSAGANRMLVVIQVKGPGTVWFDNVSITPRNPTEVVGDKTPATPPTVGTTASPDQPAEDTKPGVTITDDRRFRLNGKPFFPMMIWGWTPYSEQALGTAREWGFNIVGTPVLSDYGPSVSQAWLDAAERQGLHAMVLMHFNIHPARAAELPQRFKAWEPKMPIITKHPALFGYTLVDEPAWAGYDVPSLTEAAQWIKAQDGNHPIYINHAPRNTIEELRRYNAFADIAGSDIYPVWRDNVDKHSNLPNKTISVVGDETRKNLEAVDYKKPIMQTLQAFSWSHGPTAIDKDKPHPFPSRRQSRFMGWDSIVAGATGMTWFINEAYKQLPPELKPVIHEFAALQDVLAAGEAVPATDVFPAPIQTIAWNWEGKTVFVAINPTDKPVQTQPNWKPMFGPNPPALRVLWENRNSVVSESFQPFDVHVYTDSTKDEEILRAGFKIEAIATNS